MSAGRSLELVLKDFVEEMKQQIADHTSETAIDFTITAKGRVDGDTEITFKIEQTYDSDFDVKGGNLEAVLTEFIRRAGWQKANKPLCLPNVQQQKEDARESPDDEVPPPAPRPRSIDMDDEIPF